MSTHSKKSLPQPFLHSNNLQQTPNVIGPKQTIYLQGGGILIDKMKEVVSLKIDIDILIEATYLNGFDDKVRITQMTRKLMFDTDGMHSLRFFGPHNCTDDDCPK